MFGRYGIALLTVSDENGFLGVQHDPFAVKRADGSSAPDQLLHYYGFKSRPLDAADGRGCGLLSGYDGHEGFAWLVDDPRLADKHPPLKKGGSCQYASDGSFATFDPETHTWSLYVPYSSSPAKAHLVTVGKDGNGKPIVELASGTGLAVTLLDEVMTLTNASGSAYLVIDSSGTTVVGPFKAAGGADIGGPSSLPLVKAPPLLTELQALQTALVTVGAALSAITAIPFAAAASPAAAAAVTAIGAAQAALAAFGAAGPTLTTKGA